jgi:hypothetical protein
VIMCNNEVLFIGCSFNLFYTYTYSV